MRTGSLGALRPHLCAGSILAWHAGLYYWPGGQARSGPGNIAPGLWTTARIDPATKRVIFTMLARVRFFYADSRPDDPPPPTEEAFAIGIELERTAVEALFPAAPEPAPRRGGRDPDNDWEGAARHVADSVAADGPLPRRKDGSPVKARAVGLMIDWFGKNQPPAPERESIYRWLKQNPHPEWWGL